MFAITVPAINDQLGGRIDGDDPCDMDHALQQPKASVRGYMVSIILT